MRIVHLPANEYRRERWRNERGWTREIHRHPEGAADWQWRASIAEIDQDAPFSAFPGCDRELVLLAGEGMRLNFDDGESVTLNPPHERIRFSGERPLAAELVNGPTHDFNLIWRRDRVSAELLHRPLVGSMVFFTDPGTTWALHLLAGQAHFDKDSGLPALWAGDTALLVNEAVRQRFVLQGGGELLAIKLSRL